MSWVFVLVGLVLLVALGLVVSGRLPAAPQPTAEPRTATLPSEPTADDLDALRFPVVFRGYRMQEVDDALAVLRARIAFLEGDAGAPVASSPFAPQEPQDG